MNSFLAIIKTTHLCISNSGEAVEEHRLFATEHLKIGAMKRARLERTHQKVAHILIESFYADALNEETKDNAGGSREVPSRNRRFLTKHKLFHIKHNIITDAESVLEFENLFAKLQRTYFGFALLARIWRLKKARVQIDSDLFMTPLNPAHKHTFQLLQNGNIYYFSARDLCKIITNAITNSSFLFSEPQIARNPYNNIAFNKADLCNIYWKIRESLCVVPTILDLWFRYGFDVYKLRKLHEHEFAEYAVTNYVNGLSVQQLCEEIYEMIHEMGMQNYIQPDPSFSAERFANDMKPYLRLFLKVQYYPDKIVAANLRRELVCRLHWFANMYPYYGKLTGEVYLQQEDTSVFMTSHQYSEAKYSNYIMWGKYDDTPRHPAPIQTTTTTTIIVGVDNIPEQDSVDDDDHDEATVVSESEETEEDQEELEEVD